MAGPAQRWRWRLSRWGRRGWRLGLLAVLLVAGALLFQRRDPAHPPVAVVYGTAQPAGRAPAEGPPATPPGRPDLTGPARVVDGDTLEIAGRRVRLDAVDAPESEQVCDLHGTRWRCGRDSTDALTRFLRGRAVRCWSSGLDRFGRVLGHCWAGSQDIGAWLVSEGLAVAYHRYSARYAAQEDGARRDRRGLWASRFQNPEDWRRLHGR